MNKLQIALAITVILIMPANIHAFGDGLIISREPRDNILRYEERDGQTIWNSPTTFNFKTTIVTKAFVYGKENNLFVSIRIEELKGIPIGIPAAPHKVYTYFNSYANTIRLNKIVFHFNISESWQIPNNYTLALMIWDGNTWIELPTHMLTRNSYEAETSYMGSFVIAAIDRTPIPIKIMYPVFTLPKLPMYTPVNIITKHQVRS